MKKYKITCDFVSANIVGIVKAKNKKEALEKFESNDISEGESIDEYPTRDETNFKIEVVK